MHFAESSWVPFIVQDHTWQKWLIGPWFLNIINLNYFILINKTALIIKTLVIMLCKSYTHLEKETVITVQGMSNFRGHDALQFVFTQAPIKTRTNGQSLYLSMQLPVWLTHCIHPHTTVSWKLSTEHPSHDSVWSVWKLLLA